MLCRTIENQEKRGDLKLLRVESKVRMAPPPGEIEWGPDFETEETDDDIFMVAELRDARREKQIRGMSSEVRGKQKD